jgi:hypothetical protein
MLIRDVRSVVPELRVGWRVANGIANVWAPNGPGRAERGGICRHGRLESSLLRHHKASFDNTDRNCLLTLSRWRHGFESRWGCYRTPGQRHSPECLFLLVGWELRVYLGIDPVNRKQPLLNAQLSRRQA